MYTNIICLCQNTTASHLIKIWSTIIWNNTHCKIQPRCFINCYHHYWIANEDNNRLTSKTKQ